MLRLLRRRRAEDEGEWVWELVRLAYGWPPGYKPTLDEVLAGAKRVAGEDGEDPHV